MKNPPTNPEAPEIFIIMPPDNYFELQLPVTLPFVPGELPPPGYVPRSFNQKKGPCGEDVPTEYIRLDFLG
jgi:hypothetical protein